MYIAYIPSTYNLSKCLKQCSIFIHSIYSEKFIGSLQMFTTLTLSYFLFSLHSSSAPLEMSAVDEHTPSNCFGIHILKTNDYTIQETSYIFVIYNKEMVYNKVHGFVKMCNVYSIYALYHYSSSYITRHRWLKHHLHH